MSQFDQVSVVKKANVFAEGKCVSHTVLFNDGSRKTVGVMFPSQLQFHTKAAEILDVLDGECRVRVDGQVNFTTYRAGQSFNVPADTKFDIEIISTLHYVCHFL